MGYSFATVCIVACAAYYFGRVDGRNDVMNALRRANVSEDDIVRGTRGYYRS